MKDPGDAADRDGGKESERESLQIHGRLVSSVSFATSAASSAAASRFSSP